MIAFDMGEIKQPSLQCRICGSFELNKHHFTLAQLCNKVGLHQIFSHKDSLNRLIRPCECKGQFSHTHKVCLENWIETTKHQYCDICRFKYNVIVYDQSFFDWIFETQQVEVLLQVIVTALVVYYLVGIGILSSRDHANKGALNVFIYSTSYAWCFICSSGLLLYLYRSIGQFRNWRSINKRVVVDENKNPQLDIQVPFKDILKSSGLKKVDKKE